MKERGDLKTLNRMTLHFNKSSEKEKLRKLRQKQTHCEKIVWMHLRNRKLIGYKFKRQYSIDKFIIDFYCPELKLAVEIDGSIHELEENKIYDLERQNYIEKYGIKFIRIKNEELLENPNKAFQRIEDKIKELKK